MKMRSRSSSDSFGSEIPSKIFLRKKKRDEGNGQKQLEKEDDQSLFRDFISVCESKCTSVK